MEASRKAILEEFIDERDDFVARHEATLLEVLGQQHARPASEAAPQTAQEEQSAQLR